MQDSTRMNKSYSQNFFENVDELEHMPNTIINIRLPVLRIGQPLTVSLLCIEQI